MSWMIGGKACSLFYDYDKDMLRDFNTEQKIEWFTKRMEMIWLKPLELIFDQNSSVHKELRKHEENNDVDIMLLAFSTLLNGVESLGGFFKGEDKDLPGCNKPRFEEFVRKYMLEWKDHTKSLWENYRNALTHGFQIKDGAIEYLQNGKKKDGNKIDPWEFYADVRRAVALYFEKIKAPGELQNNFIKRFNYIYPC